MVGGTAAGVDGDGMDGDGMVGGGSAVGDADRAARTGLGSRDLETTGPGSAERVGAGAIERVLTTSGSGTSGALLASGAVSGTASVARAYGAADLCTGGFGGALVEPARVLLSRIGMLCGV
jgi:hypothetical protein